MWWWWWWWQWWWWSGVAGKPMHEPGRQRSSLSGIHCCRAPCCRRLPAPARPVASRPTDPPHHHTACRHVYDSQSQPLEVRSRPSLWQPYSPAQRYTQEQALDLVSYAFDRGIRILPEFDLPGEGSGRAWRSGGEGRCGGGGGQGRCAGGEGRGCCGATASVRLMWMQRQHSGEPGLVAS